MTNLIEVKIPDIGDFTDVEVIEVQVKVGDEVAAEDSLITLETEKAAMDVPAPQAGRVEEMLVAEGDIVDAGLHISLAVHVVRGQTEVRGEIKAVVAVQEDRDLLRGLASEPEAVLSVASGLLGSDGKRARPVLL